MDEEMLKKENQEFQDARMSYVPKIEDLSNMLKHQRNMHKIKKECMKNMIASPTLLEYPGPNAGNPSWNYPKSHKNSNSYSINKKDSIVSSK